MLKRATPLSPGFVLFLICFTPTSPRNQIAMLLGRQHPSNQGQSRHFCLHSLRNTAPELYVAPQNYFQDAKVFLTPKLFPLSPYLNNSSPSSHLHRPRSRIIIHCTLVSHITFAYLYTIYPFITLARNFNIYWCCVYHFPFDLGQAWSMLTNTDLFHLTPVYQSKKSSCTREICLITIFLFFFAQSVITKYRSL